MAASLPGTAYAYPHPYCDRHSNRDGHRYSNCDSYSYRNSNSYTYSYANGATAYSYIYADRNGDSGSYSDSDRICHPELNRNSNRHADLQFAPREYFDPHAG